MHFSRFQLIHGENRGFLTKKTMPRHLRRVNDDAKKKKKKLENREMNKKARRKMRIYK
jgi:hypothetical protein